MKWVSNFFLNECLKSDKSQISSKLILLNQVERTWKNLAFTALKTTKTVIVDYKSMHYLTIIFHYKNYTIDRLILARYRYRDRTFSVKKLLCQISHPNRTLYTVPVILN